MQGLRFAVPLVIVAGLAGCGSQTAPAMPDVTGKKLDIAQSDIKRAGFKDDVEVLGGGALGVIIKSNWEVCEQEPSAGSPMSTTPRLQVERDCDKSESTPTPEASAPTADAPPTSVEPSPSSTPTTEAALTVKNNAELARLLRSPQNDALAARFAEKYADRVIEFDGNLGAMANHGNYKTRYDMLIGAGDFDENKQSGPNFQFVDVQPAVDLYPTSKDATGAFAVGDNLHVIARVGEFHAMTSLWELEPIHVDQR
ncbi:MAG: DUF4839 domain-containing protein [Actinomycetes bacterium]